MTSAHSRSATDGATLAERVAAVESWYHRIDMGDGVVTPGAFDMAKYVHHYPIPDDLAGARVLDVGCSNGWFSAEFERRGAREVVALDLPSWVSHDWSPRYRREYLQRPDEERAHVDRTIMTDGFALVMEALGCERVRKVEMSIYDVAPEELGRFDLVLCGSMLMHVRDPLRGLHAIRSACADDALFVVSASTAFADRPEPIAAFVGEWDQCNFWQMNPACLRRMLEVADFELEGAPVLYDQHAEVHDFVDPIAVQAARPRRA